MSYFIYEKFIYENLNYINSFLNNITLNKSIFNSSSNNLMKEFRNSESMISELESKEDAPLTFSEEEREFAMDFFKYHNYYGFGIYRKLLPRNEKKHYSFSECLSLYKFDTYLRENLNKYTGVVELMFRATLIQELCNSYEGNLHKGLFYLDRSIYNSESNASDILDVFNQRMIKSKSDSAMHYVRNKNGQIPFWVIVEEATFGELYHFLTTLKQSYIDSWIANAFTSEYKKHFSSWIRTTNFLRNSCAHYSRIYGRYFNVSPPKLLKEDIKKAAIKANQNTTLFANMLTIKNIIKFNSLFIDDWNDFLEDIEVTVSNNDNLIKLYRMGFPKNWRDCLTISKKDY